MNQRIDGKNCISHILNYQTCCKQKSASYNLVTIDINSGDQYLLYKPVKRNSIHIVSRFPLEYIRHSFTSSINSKYIIKKTGVKKV